MIPVVPTQQTSLLEDLLFKFSRFLKKGLSAEEDPELDALRKSVQLNQEDLERFLGALADRFNRLPRHINPLETTFTSAAAAENMASFTTASNRLYLIDTAVTFRRQSNNTLYNYWIASSFRNISGVLTKVGTTTTLHSAVDAPLILMAPVHIASGTAIVVQCNKDAALGNGVVFDVRFQHRFQEHEL